jgi:hypothetical protein
MNRISYGVVVRRRLSREDEFVSARDGPKGGFD